MKIRQQIRRESDGTAQTGVVVRVRRESDNQTLATLTSDEDGFVTYTADGHPGPFQFQVEDQPGGTKYWSSYDATTAGPLSLPEIPIALRTLGDGVIGSFLNQLQVSVGAGNTVAVTSGGAVVAGHPVIQYTATALSVTRPSTSERIDRVIVSLRPDTSATTPGLASVRLLAGTEGAGVAPSLTQTSELYEISLASVTVPVVAPMTVTDERTFVGQQGDEAVTVRVDAVSTTSVGGAALTDATVTLALSRSGTYDLAAEVTAQQTVTAAVWTRQATYGPTFNGTAISDPNQVVVNSAGRILIADNDNDRILTLSSDGTYHAQSLGWDGVAGLAIDASGYIYVHYRGASTSRLAKYDATLTSAQWGGGSVNGGTRNGHGQIATDGTNVYVANFLDDRVWVYRASDGASLLGIGGSGSGNGQFGAGAPYGVAVDATYLYASDEGNDRITKFNKTTGAYVTHWSAGDGVAGLAIDSNGYVVATDYITGIVRRYTTTGTLVDSFTQAGAVGVGVASGDVPWIASNTSNTIAKWDEAPSGYGQIALEIDGNLGSYTGIGAITGAVSTSGTGSKAGPASVVVRVFGKATSGTMSLSNLVLTARAVAQR
jgi:hypothetical protein